MANLVLKNTDPSGVPTPATDKTAFGVNTSGIPFIKDDTGAVTTLGGTGTVTSVDVSGGSTGLTTSGGPVTGSGTITLGGTLAIANGGTGETSASAAINALVPAQTGNSGKFLSTNGTAVSWETVVTTPAGTNTQVQFNNAGAFGADSAFTWDATNNVLTVGDVQLGTIFGQAAIQPTAANMNLALAMKDTTTGIMGPALELYGSNATAGNISGGVVLLQAGSGSGTGQGGDVLISSGPGGLGQPAGSISLNVGGSSTFEINANKAVAFDNQFGTAGQVLTSNGTGSAPTWTTPTTGTVTSVTVDGTANEITSSGSPITSSGTITVGLASNPVIPGNQRLRLPTGTTANRPGSPQSGDLRFNTTTSVMEVYRGSNWKSLVGLTDANFAVSGFGSHNASTNELVPRTITAGTNISVTNGDGVSGDPTIAFSGTLGIANGGTGQTTANAALNALLPSQTSQSGKYLTTDGTNTSWAAVSGTGTVTSVDVSGGTTGLTFTGGPITSSGTITMSGTLDEVNGGTGQTSYATGDILYASASNTLSKLPAGTNGHVLTLSSGVPTWAAGGGGGDSFTLRPVRVATTANGALATAFENGDTIDGVVLATGDRILLKNQTTATENGVYVVNATGAPTRAADFDTGAATLTGGVLIPVRAGTQNSGTMWQCSNTAAITIGSTNITFVRQGVQGYVAYGSEPTTRPTAGTSNNSIAIGNNAQVSSIAGSGSVAIGASSNVSAAVSSIAIGQSAFAGGADSGPKIVIGTSSSNEADSATVIGANTSVSSSNPYGIFIGRYAGSNNAKRNIVGFNSAVGRAENAFAVAPNGNANSGFTSFSGAYQWEELILYARTTTATETEMFANGTVASDRLVLPNNSMWSFRIMLQGMRTDVRGDAMAWIIEGSIDRESSAGTTALVSSVTTTEISNSGALTWTPTVSADTTNGALKVTVIGEAGKTIRWFARVSTVEMNSVTG